MCKHNVVKTRYFLSYGYYKGLEQQKWSSASVKLIGNRAIWQAILYFLFIFYCNYVSISHHFRDIIDYFPKFKEDHDHTHLRDFCQSDMAK